MALILTLLFCVGILYFIWINQLNDLRLLLSLAFVVSLGFTFFHTLYLDYKVNYQFQPAQCKIVQSTVITKQYTRMTLYVPTFQAEFLANNQLTNQFVKLNITEYGMLSAANAQAVANQYQPEQIYPCWYDSNDVSNVVLEQGWYSGIGTWGVTLLALMFFVVTFYLVNISPK